MEKKEFKPTKKQILDSLILKGDEVIIGEEKQDQWFTLCCKCMGSNSAIYVLNEALEVMKNLQNNEINVVVEEFLKKGYEHNLAMQILNVVLKYSDNGLSFVELITGENFSYQVSSEIKNSR